MTTRAEWQTLADDRILDARAHLVAGVDRWSAAYYLAGYAVECGLKACVLARVATFPEVIYPDRKVLKRCLDARHRKALLLVAGIKDDRDNDANVRSNR